jgi:hypothetical protein
MMFHLKADVEFQAEDLVQAARIIADNFMALAGVEHVVVEDEEGREGYVPADWKLEGGQITLQPCEVDAGYRERYGDRVDEASCKCNSGAIWRCDLHGRESTVVMKLDR